MASSILFQNALPPASSLRLRQTSFPAAVKPDASRSTQISRFTSYVRIPESDLDEYASAEPDFSTAQLLAKMGITLKVQAILHDGQSPWTMPIRPKLKKCGSNGSPSSQQPGENAKAVVAGGELVR